MRFPYAVLLSACALMLASPLPAQSPNGVLNGLVVDPGNRVIVGADVVVVNDVTGVQYTTRTNDEGIYVLPNLPPAPYRVQVSKVGFKTLIKPDIILNVQDALSINFTLPIGALSETVTVSGGAPLVNTESATVSTVVDRNFAENLPMNGRSFQTLIQLTPGVVLTPYSNYDNGQFSVNGQRSSSNYWMVDGVSANTGIGTSNFSAGNGLSGSNAGLSVLGGTNSLVSVDALQEFRIQTSTYAPEFGRTPGGQISIVTRSGTNQWHGSAFDYLRNDILDANSWFADHNNLAKPEERQNDFGGTLGGPIIRDRTFFFFSYEGLRLRLPQVAEELVPDISARQSAVPAMQPYLNAFPLPTPGAPDDVATGIGEFKASFSNSARLDAYSLRIDHRLDDKRVLFGRYSYSPSTSDQRGNGTLNSVTPSLVTIQTGTVGATWSISPSRVNDLRFNYSRTDSNSHTYMDEFGGGTPLVSLPFPSGFDSSNGALALFWVPLAFSGPRPGFQGHNLQRQVNIVDSLTVQVRSHTLKFGVDFRRLSPVFGNFGYFQEAEFGDVPSSTLGDVAFVDVGSGRGGTLYFHNLGAFAQDTWRVNQALTITYGLRWDVDFAPSSRPNLLAVTSFSLSDLSGLAAAPAGTPPFQTTYGNVAPRIGIAYQLAQSQRWQTVLRGGFGLFYDAATSEVGNSIYPLQYPFGNFKFCPNPSNPTCPSGSLTFPLNSTTAEPPPISISSLPTSGTFGVFDPHLRLPYTPQWNVSLSQALGTQAMISATYIGSVGRRLLQTTQVLSPNANFSQVSLIANAAASDYDSLQLQFQRRLSRGFQAVASYAWAHSIDTASAGSAFGNNANALLPSSINQNRGPSDFDIRNAFSAGLTYDVPVPRSGPRTNVVLAGWSIESVVQSRSAMPVNAYDGAFFLLDNRSAQVRPDVVAGQSFYLKGSNFPGGKAFNLGAFESPPTDPSGNPLRQGDLGRNALRGFGAVQWDLAVHRDFSIRGSWKLQFRAEMFNVVNHPNFAPPVSDISNTTQFGLSTRTLGSYLAGSNLGSGALNPLYQIGGPRSIQCALKLTF